VEVLQQPLLHDARGLQWNFTVLSFPTMFLFYFLLFF
jgi:hypothetical protein